MLVMDLETERRFVVFGCSLDSTNHWAWIGNPCLRFAALSSIRGPRLDYVMAREWHVKDDIFAHRAGATFSFRRKGINGRPRSVNVDFECWADERVWPISYRKSQARVVSRQLFSLMREATS